ncbi:MAG: hypothetical protein AUK34_12775 [Ignavibacteria bacterium CG2_30_36_16]|nr:MAG: hypothetical protein AUK34_12775 [Ignavibacteria bacterium CG2_30_36_16]PJB01319.1 MAG: hypothetical protein CO127_04410 [Ignavibacteria bacterium CG_4_9_14_3_um_filter_36_18]
MPEDIKSIGDIINNDPVFSNLRNVMQQSDVVIEFIKIFPDLLKIASAVKVEKKTLFLRVENSAWRSEIKFKEKIIIDKVNEYFKDDRIKAVRFVK